MQPFVVRQERMMKTIMAGFREAAPKGKAV